MKKINFVLGFHSHQPVGNFESIFEDSFQKSYKPFLDVFSKFPEVKVSLHYTGELFDWIAEKHPDYIKAIKAMIKRGQVEIMTGAYYEPILPIIPDHDKVEQISAFSERLNSVFGKKPRGMWLAERVWEPHLPLFINKAGVEYTVVDDSHFKCTGLSEVQTLGYYVTEELGYPIKIFPISEKMRYTIPFRPVEETIEYLNKMATEEGTRIVVMADDGEKFGVWPDTYKHCYENKWFEKFLQALKDNSSWINCITFSEAVDKFKPIGRIYLPTASYIEMMEWVQPPDTIHHYEHFVKNLKDRNEYEDNKIFVSGGFWRNFLVKYPESNNIHKKMIYVSNKINAEEAKAKGKKQKEAIAEAKKSLWKGQVNCGYWHGVFGGLYLPHLRRALYGNLVKADAIIESVKNTESAWDECVSFDFDVDGIDEVIYQSGEQNLYFKPDEGAMLFEQDFLKGEINLIDTLARREEAYHVNVIKAQLANEKKSGGAESIHEFIRTKELGLEKYLNYDWHRRASLIDHFTSESTTLDAFASAKYPEFGDFVNQEYQYKIKKTKAGFNISFERDGALYINGNKLPVRVHKNIHIEKDSAGFIADYAITNLSNTKIKTRFGVEFNVNLQAGSAPDRYYWGNGIPASNNFLNSKGEVPLPAEFGVTDQWQKITVKFKTNKTNGMFWRFPIETISLSEAGFERVYQSSVLFPNWIIDLNPGEKWETSIENRQEKF